MLFIQSQLETPKDSAGKCLSISRSNSFFSLAESEVRVQLRQHLRSSAKCVKCTMLRNKCTTSYSKFLTQCITLTKLQISPLIGLSATIGNCLQPLTRLSRLPDYLTPKCFPDEVSVHMLSKCTKVLPHSKVGWCEVVLYKQRTNKQNYGLKITSGLSSCS